MTCRSTTVDCLQNEKLLDSQASVLEYGLAVWSWSSLAYGDKVLLKQTLNPTALGWEWAWEKLEGP